MELEGKGRVRVERTLPITLRTMSVMLKAIGGHEQVLSMGIKSSDFSVGKRRWS